MKILRKTIDADNIVEFKFDVKAFSFLVKNLTSDDILVCFNDFDENSNIKIPALMSQIITQNVNHSDTKYSTDTLQIKSSGEGEVEVQCLMY